jgi:cysteine-rich secretory family protein
MRRARLLGIAMALAASMSGVLALATPARADGVNSSDEAQFVSLINQLRSSVGAGQLSVDSRLTSIARSWSSNMVTTGLHHNPDLASEAPSGWTMLGENVGYGQSVSQLETAFQNSAHHYANMVEPAFTTIGVGVVVANGTLWVTEDFMAAGATVSAPVRAVPTSPPTTRPPSPRAAPTTTTTAAPVAAAPAAAPPPPTPPPDPTVRLLAVLRQLESLDRI